MHRVSACVSWLKEKGPVGLAVVAICVLVVSTTYAQLPRQNCASDGLAGCPSINNGPSPPNGAYYCDRSQGPASKSCAGVAITGCAGQINGACGVKKFCGSNMNDFYICGYNEYHQAIWCARACTQTSNFCDTFP